MEPKPTSRYPRTSHLAWSPGLSDKEKIIPNLDSLLGAPLIICEKVDGGNVTIRRDNLFARSHNGHPTHISFDWLKGFYASLRHLVPANTSLFVEYTYAVHSIRYEKLPHCVFLFGVRYEQKERWGSWEEVCGLAERLALPTAPVLTQGVFSSEEELKTFTNKEAQKSSIFGGPREGVVVRTAAGFHDRFFRSHLAKWVRKNHMQVDRNWWYKPVERQNFHIEI